MFRKTSKTRDDGPVYTLPSLAEMMNDKTWCANCGRGIDLHQHGDCPDGSAGWLPVTDL